MEKLLEKISEYEVLNNFFPGLLFCYLLNRFTPFSISAGNEFVNIFIYYFVGMIIGRFGSLILEPILYHGDQPSDDDFEKIMVGEEYRPKQKPFALKTPWKYYYEASKEDTTIQTLNSKKNMYRSIASLFFCFFLVKLYSITLYQQYPELNEKLLWIGALALMVFFIFSIRKQTDYIMKRCISAIKKSFSEAEGDSF